MTLPCRDRRRDCSYGGVKEWSIKERGEGGARRGHGTT